MTCALVVIGLLAAWVLVENRIHDEIRRTIEQRLAEHYTNFRVSVRTARLIEGRGIEIHGVSISERDGRTPIAYVGEVFVTCRIGMQQLLSGEKPQAEHLMVHGLEVWAEQGQDGSWNVERLWPLPQFGCKPPPATIKDAVVEIAAGNGETARRLSLRKVNSEIFRESATPVADRSPAREIQPAFRVTGSLVGDHFETAGFHARIDPNTGTWTISGVVDGLQLSPRLQAAVPAPWQEKLDLLSSVSGRAKLDFYASKHGEGDEPIRFSFAGTMADGQIADPRLPVRLHGLCAEFYLDNDRLMIEDLSAHNGPSTLQLSFERKGLDEDSPFALRAEARQLDLDRRFVDLLPDRFQPIWRQYFPMGVIDADVILEFDGRQWKRDIDVTCHDVSFVYYKFPYRIERARGTIALKDDILEIQLGAMAGGQVATINGTIHHPDKDATGWIDIACKQPIPIDEKLLKSLVDAKAQEIVRSFRPGGSISFEGRFGRQNADDPQMHRDVKIELHNCTMQYAKFPYPLSMIQGSLAWNDQGWTFNNLSGRNDSGYIECEGNWRRSAGGGSQLELDFVGVDVPLEDELRRSLTPSAQRLWSELRPRGTIDHLLVNLRYASATKDLSLKVRAQKRKKNANDEGRSISIYPVWFPYPLDDVAGTWRFEDGAVQLEKVSAVHDKTQISLDGQCNFAKNGLWDVRLTDVVADGVRFDRELLAALPEGLRKAVAKLNLLGDISMQGAIALAGNAGVGGPPAANWDVTFDVEDGGLNCGLALDHIHGEVRLNGGSSQHEFYSHGELKVDSMFYRGVQLTQIRGPFLIKPGRIVLGAEAERGRADVPPRPVTADAIGGRLSVDATVQFDGDTPFVIQTRLDRGDLALLAQEMALRNKNIRGKANALVTLSGNRYGRNSWRGNGKIRLYEADIYEIPVMLALLKLLTIPRRPDTTAFTSSEIDFRIQGEHTYFDRINFHGDLFSLKGRGEANLDRRIDLTFYTLVGRREFSWALVRAMLQQVSKEMLLIHVTGTLDQPILQRRPLPALRETLDQIFPELANRPKPERSLPRRPLGSRRQRLPAINR
jgi:hypothetical protein